MAKRRAAGGGKARWYMIVVPEEFAERTIAREGAAGRAWIAALPERVAALVGQWGLAVDGPPMHGGLSLVVPVRRDAEPCVLKIAWVDVETEAIALRAWGWAGRRAAAGRGPGAARAVAGAPRLWPDLE